MIRKYDEYLDENGHTYHVYEVDGDKVTLKLVRRNNYEKNTTVVIKQSELAKRYRKTTAGAVTCYRIGDKNI